MSPKKPIHCMVDDTALSNNISEIENWVSQGAIVLIIPLYTLDRLKLLKKDASQIGQNARKAVKFLDRMTSGKHELPTDPIILQESEEQYATWEEVEAHYKEENVQPSQKSSNSEQKSLQPEPKHESDKAAKRTSGGALSQMLLEKLNFASQPNANSPTSSPRLSPVSSEPQSSKNSPEVKAATLTTTDKSPVPSALKPLLNPVVWYVHEKANGQTNLFFLTNSADTQHLARDFSVPAKTIHQMRNAVGPLCEQPERTHRKQRSTSSLPGNPDEDSKTLFSYDDESDEEEVVFKPRGRGSRPAGIGRGGHHGSMRNKNPSTRSPRLSFSSPTPPAINKPQIPIEEIDPDSFDRGSFGRGSVPLANTGSVGNHAPNQFNGFPRGPSHRASHAPGGPSRGMNQHRGTGRGLERGSARGRGRLFVP